MTQEDNNKLLHREFLTRNCRIEVYGIVLHQVGFATPSEVQDFFHRVQFEKVKKDRPFWLWSLDLTYRPN